MPRTREGLERGGHRELTVRAYAVWNAIGQIVGVFLGPGKSTMHLE